MKNNRKKVARPKYLTGSKVTSYIENPYVELQEDQINTAQAKSEAEQNPWVIGLNTVGAMLQQYSSSIGGAMGGGGPADKAMGLGDKSAGTDDLATMALGGMAYGVPINAEGKEIIQTPGGKVAELKGPSHANGGIDLDVPNGTEIFSQRLKGPDGKTMADRKKLREKNIGKIDKLLEESPSDKALRKARERVALGNEREEKQDMAHMEMARMIQETQKFALGGTADIDPEKNPFAYFLKTLDPSIFGEQPLTSSNIDAMDLSRYESPINGNTTTPTASKATGGGFGDFFNKLFGANSQNGTAGGMTAGDITGMAGNLISTFGPMMNTQANRAGDTPNINAFKDFGADALKTIDESKQYVAGQRDNNLEDLELARNSAIRRGRNSARSVNTMRALDLATDQGVNNSKSQIYNQFAQMMQSILGQQAGFENQRDQVVMQGEQNRDLADRQDRDNYFSQMAEDISTQGTGIQKIGKDMNTMKTRETTSKVMDSLFPDFNINAYTGEMKKVITNEASSGVEFYKSIPDVNLRRQTLDNVSNGIWIRKGNKVYDATTGKEINVMKTS